MSKKQASLFQFFPSPGNSAKKQTTVTSTPPPSTSTGSKKREHSGESPKPKAKKRLRIVVSEDSDSDEDPKLHLSSSSCDEEESKPDNSSIIKTPLKNEKIKKTPANNSAVKKEAMQTAPHLSEKTVDKDMRFSHQSLRFLQPDEVQDKNRRRPTDPEYDVKTLFVPAAFIKNQTPAMQQWWEMKSNHFDCILFFKVGKFYELYHMDAVVGAEELGFTYMRGNYAHCGFPESAYGRMAASLVEKGYKVARVEQTETPDMLHERAKQTTKNKPKVVAREICQITSKGTRVYGTQDLDPNRPEANYLLAIYENTAPFKPDDKKLICSYGICFVETSLGKFSIGQINDDINRSALHLLISHYPPAMVICCRKNLSEETKNILQSSYLTGIQQEYLAPNTQFYDAAKTIKMLQEKKYFTNSDGKVDWPSALKKMLEGDGVTVTARPGYNLALTALGGILWYLNYSLVDDQLLSMRNFIEYKSNMGETALEGQNMILDVNTIHHLRIVDREGSLMTKLNFCKTAFGKRLLRQWVCSPLCDVSEIRERQVAIQTLMERPENIKEAWEMLKMLPDLERMLSKIHALGNKTRSQTHPDSRAIFFEEKTYSKKKIADFIRILDGFERSMEICKIFSGLENGLLKRCTSLEPEGMFPDLSKNLQFFQNAFDKEEARSTGKILPSSGCNEEYDQVLIDIEGITEELEEYRKKQEKIFGCKISYFGSDKKRYQLDIPEEKTHKVTEDYLLQGTKKGNKPTKRYQTPATKDLLTKMIAAEERKRVVLLDVCRALFEKFSQGYNTWSTAVHCLAVLDVLISLAEYSKGDHRPMCVPSVIEPTNAGPFIDIKEGRHPCLSSSNDFIPNDTILGTQEIPSILILTGPNMGGKSTLMRQVALLCIQAQIGCLVPAVSCRLSVVDRIFTRIGARDDIFQGKSTFMVEMSETKSILEYATHNSLALIDELGRGTSTHDGTAIAAGVLDYIQCKNYRTIFSTHFHQLIPLCETMPTVYLGHMMCMDDEDGADDDDDEESVTLLYKLANGPCPRSYGFNAARLAGVPADVIRRGRQIAAKLERESRLARLFAQLMQADTIAQPRYFFSQL